MATHGMDPRILRPGGLTLTERAIAHCSFAAGARIVDIGCGAGATVEYLRQRHSFSAVGIDLAFSRLTASLERNPGLPLVQGDSRALPFASGLLDGIISECSLSVISDKESVLTELQRVLKPTGMLVITDVFVEKPDAIDLGLLSTASVLSCPDL